MAFAHNEIGIKEADDGTIDFENGNKAFKGTTGNDVFDVIADGGAGHKAKDWSLTGGDGDDRLTGGEGDDMISGGAGIDRLFGGRGDDLIVMVEGNAGVALNLTAAEVEAFYGGKGNDAVTAAGSLGVYINGGEGNDSLSGSAEGDFLIGGDGNDELSGGDEGDYLHGGAGIDGLYGGAGDDVVVADGEDGLFIGKVLGGAGYDILIVTGDDATPRTFDLQALGFESAVGGAGNDTITAYNYIDENGDKVGAILSGREGNDILVGAGAEDILDGGIGNDVVNGSYGSDIVIYRRGDGSDQLHMGLWSDGGRDAIAFGSDITPEDLVFDPEGVDLILKVLDNGAVGGQLTVKYALAMDGTAQPLETLTFSNGVVLDIANAKIYNPLSSVDNVVTFTETAGSRDTPLLLQAGGGNDIIRGGGEKDDEGDYKGIKGNDIFFGQAGNDWIEGGAGHAMNGGFGHDVLPGDAEQRPRVGWCRKQPRRRACWQARRRQDRPLKTLNARIPPLHAPLPRDMQPSGSIRCGGAGVTAPFRSRMGAH